MKRLILAVFLTVTCLIVALWSPWLGWDLNISRLFGVEKKEEISGLQVISLSGDIEVFVDGVTVGSASKDNFLIVDRVTPEEHLVTLKRKSDIRNAYWSFNELISFEADTQVIVSYNLGPEEEFSEGHVIYATKKSDLAKSSVLNVEVDTEDVAVQLDDIPTQRITERKLTEVLTFDKQHRVVITKSGYESLEFLILPESQEDRDILQDYDINVKVRLAALPVKVE